MSIAGVFQAVGAGVRSAAAMKGTEYVAGAVAGALTATAVGTTLNKAISAVVRAMQAGAGQNLVSKSAGVRVEPFVLVDSRAVRLPYIKDVLNVNQRLFTAYYMLGVSSENKIGSIKVAKRLDNFAPDRNLLDATASFLTAGADMQSSTASFLSTESYHFGLPFVGEAAGLHRYAGYTTEANNPVVAIRTPQASGASVNGGGAAKIIQDVGNLAIGQIVDVQIQDGGATGTVQVMIRLRVMGIDPVAIAGILALGGNDNGISARLRKFRVGELTMWNDLVMQQDRIDEYRRTVFADKSGYFRKAHARKNKSLLATLLTGTPSVAEATSIAIITKETQLETEDRMNGRFSDFATRQRMFEDSLLMLLTVIDADMETVTIYTRDIEDYATHTIKDLKGPGAANSNGDLADIMKSYLEGRVPGRL